MAAGADVVGAEVAAVGALVLGAELGDDTGAAAVVGAPLDEEGDDEPHAARSAAAMTKAAMTTSPGPRFPSNPTQTPFMIVSA